ncbi:MAG: LysR family transcriptional regulator [Myxococcota bacterium]
MNTPLALDVYVTIVEAGSISEAARTLGEPRATLSRQLTRLEDHLGVRLVHRSTRTFEVTRAGLELYHRGRRIVDEVRAAEQALRRLDDVPRGPLRLSVPPGPGGEVFGELLATFLDRFPEVRPDVLATDRHVDLVREGFDVALRAGAWVDPSLVRRVITHHRTVLVAAPAYLAAHGAPTGVDGLAAHRWILGYGGGDRVHAVVPLRDGGGLRVEPRVASNELGVTLALVTGGHGLAVLPDLAVAEAVAAGRLVVVLPELVGADVTLAVVYPERRLIEPQVRAFIDHAVAFFADRPPLIRCPTADRARGDAVLPAGTADRRGGPQGGRGSAL